MKTNTYFGSRNIPLLAEANKKIGLQCIGCLQYKKAMRSLLCLECRSCISKDSYSSKKVANASSTWFSSNYEEPVNLFAYKCQFCNMYHLTSDTRIEVA
jgi:hypothetical protein